MEIFRKTTADLLYNENKFELIAALKAAENAELLYIYIGNYNWNDGFEIPTAVVGNKNCDLGIALLAFDRADGLGFLVDRNEKNLRNDIYMSSWVGFVDSLYNRVLAREFSEYLQYIPNLTALQKYKLEKIYPEIPKIFIEGTSGEILEIPNL
ncbi:MAG: DUF4274 domain-containing protein [Turicibacter sp.]|nr:DUF4274 domain-containing protein [Turicibacter sp.]